MADDITVTNTSTSFNADTNPDYLVKTTDSGSGHVQHVNVDACALPTDAATETALQSILTELGAKTEPADQQHVIIDSGTVTVTEPVSVDDNGGSLTVDGSVTANAGTDLNTSLLALEAGGNLAAAATSLAVIDDWDESDRCKVTSKSALTGSAPATASISTSSAELVATNASRKGLFIVNTHATNRISLGFGQTAVLDRGVTLWPREKFWMDEYSFTTGAINAIAAGASTTVGTQEFT